MYSVETNVNNVSSRYFSGHNSCFVMLCLCLLNRILARDLAITLYCVTCLLSIKKSLASARVSKLTATNIYIYYIYIFVSIGKYACSLLMISDQCTTFFMCFEFYVQISLDVNVHSFCVLCLCYIIYFDLLLRLHVWTCHRWRNVQSIEIFVENSSVINCFCNLFCLLASAKTQ